MSSKLTFSNITSKSYALALYELSMENSELEKVEVGIKDLNAILKENSNFKEVILSPTITKEEKKNVIFAIAIKSNFSETLKKFLGFLTINNRLFFLKQIIESFLNIVSKNKGELKAKFITPNKLSVEEQKNIQKELSKDLKSQLNIDYTHDPNLIAGLIIQVGSVMVDTSIKTKLKKLEKNMIET